MQCYAPFYNPVSGHLWNFSNQKTLPFPSFFFNGTFPLYPPYISPPIHFPSTKLRRHHPRVLLDTLHPLNKRQTALIAHHLSILRLPILRFSFFPIFFLEMVPSTVLHLFLPFPFPLHYRFPSVSSRYLVHIIVPHVCTLALRSIPVSIPIFLPHSVSSFVLLHQFSHCPIFHPSFLALFFPASRHNQFDLCAYPFSLHPIPFPLLKAVFPLPTARFPHLMSTFRFFFCQPSFPPEASFLPIFSLSSSSPGNDRLNEVNQNRQNANRIYDSQDNAKGGYSWGPPMYFYVGSELLMQWTCQHGCGGNSKTDCNFVIQYACEDTMPGMRDGTVTTTVPDNAETQKEEKYGRQELYDYYQDCKARSRNKGLFVADQKPGNSARSTRQNPGGTRHGFECPEERDYYPYWHPTPWRDVAILTDNTTRCEWYQAESQNVKARNKCSDNKYNNKAECEQNGGKWEEVKPFAKPANEAPECLQAEFNKVNHLGYTANGHMNQYMWKIPNHPAKNCVLRLRYNISTHDVNFWDPKLDASKNKAASPIKQDPMIEVMKDKNLSMALNTNQYGRTFQDRTFMFEIRKRPTNIPAEARIVNLNIRGKRGNIVQTYPAQEYDFVPNKVEVKEGEYVHIQWTGSDYNANNGNNNAEGTTGTDRNNLVQVGKMGMGSKIMPTTNQTLFEDKKMAERAAYLDQADCLTYAELMEKHGNNKNAIETDEKNCMKLNAASPYFDVGLVKMNKTGVYEYTSTRNNNFSNRSQKGSMVVAPAVPDWGWAIIGVGAGAVTLGGAAGAAYYKGLIGGASTSA
eukprot:TRINITY_DN178_c0_g2_i2.p1 TRINITY_DN178_c0_g2~~TRINITY_DN178_c0_g2_i2.p1  ORF type:complete len:799 (+),score=167.20 TRINITY_DN178_c0_g2_i2:346-2742(+)